MSLIEFNSLGLVYEGEKNQSEPTQALKDINLKIEEKEFVVILGASGCGKTSLLNIAAGFLFPTAGEAKIKGELIKKPHPERGVVFQKNALMPWLNVQDNVELALKFAGMPKKERAAISDQALTWVGLQEFKEHYVYQLSGGMQQRVGMARALASDPKVLLLDEPLGALDAITREEVQEVILDVWNKTKKTILMVTHSIEEALFMSTRLVIMTPRPGRILQTHDLAFSKMHLQGMPGKEIKQRKDFIDLKSEILQIVHSEAGA